MMSSLSHRYQDFGSNEGAELPSAPPVPENQVEDLQLASFDTGYQAGWDDALKAHETDIDRVSIGVAQNLQDMALTQREAYLKLNAAMRPLMTKVIETLLPEISRQALTGHILQQIDCLMDRHSKDALEIAVSEENYADIESLLSDLAQVPFKMCKEPNLKSGQVHLRATANERDIDLDAVLTDISEVFEAFYDQTKEEMTDE